MIPSPLEEKLLVERRASWFSSFPALGLPCAFSALNLFSPTAAADDGLSCYLQCTGWSCLCQWVLTGTRCEPSKLFVCFGQKTNCVCLVIWTNLVGSKLSKAWDLANACHDNCHFCQSCSKEANFEAKYFLRKMTYLPIVIVRSMAITSTHFAEDPHVCEEEY